MAANTKPYRIESAAVNQGSGKRGLLRLWKVAVTLPSLAACLAAPPEAADCRTAGAGDLAMSLPPPDFPVDPRRSDPHSAVRGHRGLYDEPIIDTHVHLLKGLKGTGVRGVLAHANQAGVVRLIALPTPNEGMYKQQDEKSEARRRLARTPHGRGGRLCGSTYLTRWMHNAAPTGYTPNDLDGRLARLARDLDSGVCLGVGEIGPLYFVNKPGQAVIAFPLNIPPC